MRGPVLLACHPFDDDHLKEECGVFGIANHPDAAALTALGLHALQHRGQESAGIVTFDAQENQFQSHRDLGHVRDTLSTESVMRRLRGRAAIGHVRYSTTGDTLIRNVQPLFADFEFGGLAICHNGNLTNARTLRHQLVRRGCLFQSTTDTEVLVHLIANSPYSTVEHRMIDALRRVEGAYSILAMTRDTIFGMRDPLGVRPLVLGRLDEVPVLASETCALDIMGATFEREVEPGELVVINSDGALHSLHPFPRQHKRFCVFELIYFARPDSQMESRSVYDVRKNIGAELARESMVDADVVVPVPDSGVPAALGFANESGLPFELGIIRSHYMGRTFIQPSDSTRNLGVRLKHNINKGQLEGKRVVLVDDSIVRGTTSRKIVEMVRAAGAAEVHMRISSPPTTHSCFYGIDTPEREKLLAARFDLEGVRAEIGADSLAYISLNGLYRACGMSERNAEYPQFCDACFTGDYPTHLTDHEAGTLPIQLTMLDEEPE